MKVKMECYVNYGGYYEYAVLVKKHWWSKWHYLRNDNGHRALYKYVDAEKLCDNLMK